MRHDHELYRASHLQLAVPGHHTLTADLASHSHLTSRTYNSRSVSHATAELLPAAARSSPLPGSQRFRPAYSFRTTNPCRTTMDIDDLLAEVAVDSTPQESRDLQELTRAWVAERTAPEILNWPEELMERVLERIRRQVCCRAQGKRDQVKTDCGRDANGVGRLSSWKIRQGIWIRRRISNSLLYRRNSSGSSFWLGAF